MRLHLLSNWYMHFLQRLIIQIFYKALYGTMAEKLALARAHRMRNVWDVESFKKRQIFLDAASSRGR